MFPLDTQGHTLRTECEDGAVPIVCAHDWVRILMSTHTMCMPLPTLAYVLSCVTVSMCRDVCDCMCAHSKKLSNSQKRSYES